MYKKRDKLLQRNPSRNLKKPGLRFNVGREHFEAMTLRIYFPDNSKMTSDRCVFSQFLRRSVDGKDLMCFQSETFVFKFLRRSVDRKHLMRFQSETSVFNSSRVVWMENISCVFRVKPSLRSPKNNMGNNVSATCVLVYQDLNTGRF